jgi:hypothetical protein
MFKGFWSKSFMLAGKTVSVKVAALATIGVVTVGSGVAYGVYHVNKNDDAKTNTSKMSFKESDEKVEPKKELKKEDDSKVVTTENHTEEQKEEVKTADKKKVVAKNNMKKNSDETSQTVVSSNSKAESTQKRAEQKKIEETKNYTLYGHGRMWDIYVHDNFERLGGLFLDFKENGNHTWGSQFGGENLKLTDVGNGKYMMEGFKEGYEAWFENVRFLDEHVILVTLHRPQFKRDYINNTETYMGMIVDEWVFADEKGQAYDYDYATNTITYKRVIE